MRWLLTLALLCPFVTATDIYFAATSAGSNNGTSCANAYAYNDGSHGWNVAGNWVAGNVLHSCGAFSFGNNGAPVTVGGSGSSGNPVIFKWETGSTWTANYWSTSAVTCSGQNFITFDGGTNGSITATANGTSLANQINSTFFNFSSCNNVIVQNLTGTNLYQRSSPTDTTAGGNGTHWILYNTGCDHINANHNTLSGSRSDVEVIFSTVTDAQVYNNTFDYCSWCIIFGQNNTNNTASGVVIHDNNIGPHINIWLDTGAQTMHADEIDLFAVLSGATISATVYNNYLHGDMCSGAGVNCTAYLYIDGALSGNFFNNVIVSESGGGEGNIVVRGEGNTVGAVNIYNNTNISLVVGGSNGIKTDFCCGGATGNQQVYKNNLFLNFANNYLSGPDNYNQLSAVNFDDYFAYTTFAMRNSNTGPGHSDTFAVWQTDGFDANGTVSDPKLNTSTFQVASGSAAISAATNLTSLCSGALVPLCTDKSGVARPPTGNWTIGANQFASAPPATSTKVQGAMKVNGGMTAK